MPGTVAPAPTDTGMLRKLVSRAHPDCGGTEDLVVWANATRDHVLSGVTGAGVSHIVGLEEEWEAAYNNIFEADNVTAAEPEEIAERFETYAQPEITQHSILAGDHPELNKLGMIR